MEASISLVGDSILFSRILIVWCLGLSNQAVRFINKNKEVILCITSSLRLSETRPPMRKPPLSGERNGFRYFPSPSGKKILRFT